MKRFLILSVAICAMAVTPLMAGENTTYGAGVTLEETVAIDVLLANADQYAGKTVVVEGVITGVCKKRGCWMQITDPESGDGVRIKVEDGVIVFPYEAMGHEAKAEGIFEAIKLTPEQIEARTEAAHKHKEGESCDKDRANAQAGTGCDLEPVNQYVYLIRGTGAVIKG
jgi:hypothetical protein